MRLVGAAGVADVRHRVAEAAVRVGLDDDRVAGFTVAANEIIINAIQHGGGSAEITISTTDRQVVVKVRDHGTGIPDEVPTELPPADQVHGRGLWLARQLCDEVTLLSTDSGALVRLAAAADWSSGG